MRALAHRLVGLVHGAPEGILLVRHLGEVDAGEGVAVRARVPAPIARVEADVFAAQLAREEGKRRARAGRARGDGGMTGADAILGSGGAHQRGRRRDVAPGSILGMGDLGRRGEMFAAEGADGGLEGAHQG